MLLETFPEIEPALSEWEELDHLKMAEFQRFTAAAAERNDWQLVRRCLDLADRLFRDGDAYINNAVYVSFLENVDNTSEWWPRLREMMSPELQHGHDEMEEFWKKVEDGQRSKPK